MKWGQRERVKRGEYNLGNNRVLGYDCVDGVLVPNKDADAVRLIYALYLQGKSIEEIRRRLEDIGVKSRKGSLISHGDILYILKNETYKGDKLLQKTHPKDLITKKPDPKVEFESNYLEGDHEAIVDEETWSAVQQKMEENKKMEAVVGHRGGRPHFLYGKIFCGECGEPMIRRTVNGPGGAKCKTWVCRSRNKGKCKGRNVKEENLMATIQNQLGGQFDEGVFSVKIQSVKICPEKIVVAQRV